MASQLSNSDIKSIIYDYLRSNGHLNTLLDKKNIYKITSNTQNNYQLLHVLHKNKYINEEQYKQLKKYMKDLEEPLTGGVKYKKHKKNKRNQRKSKKQTKRNKKKYSTKKQNKKHRKTRRKNKTSK
jgi:hypothetical protein